MKNANNEVGVNNGKLNQYNIDNTINNNIKIIKESEKPKRKNKEEIEKMKKEVQRPYLKHKLNEIVHCFGYIVGRYRNTNRYTVINIVDVDGNYVADHIQLDLQNYENELIKPLGENSIYFIRFKGMVRQYIRQDKTIDYEIRLIDKPIVFSIIYYNMQGSIDYDIEKVNKNKIINYLSTTPIDDLYNLLEKLKDEVNDLTRHEFGLNYVYSYVVNQYMLNSATYDLYNQLLHKKDLNEDLILDLIILLSSIVYIFKYNEQVTLVYMMKYISYMCDILQGILNQNKTTEEFKRFCKEKLKVEGKRKIEELVRIIRLRRLNFGNNDLEECTENNLYEYAYCVLNDMIK